ncbi:Hint domain-containing protein [Sulfitobacter sp. 1151]|uniref:Hint domain-containing protein n=1 Tax=Parasulfitobacter algicola TaxID=2614809 RepID=A0ABX2IU88_9RHOB|nr:Hint domain-containing protein [Sulfitobacter algicola]
MIVQDWRVDFLIGADQALIAAKHFVNGIDIICDPGGVVEYFHILFETHQILFAENVPTESLHPGQISLNAFDDAAKVEILQLFPQLGCPDNYGNSAATSLKSHEALAVLAL